MSKIRGALIALFIMGTVASPAGALTFLGTRISNNSSRVAVSWSTSASSESLVVALPFASGETISGTQRDTSVSIGPSYLWGVSGYEKWRIAGSGHADSTAPVVVCAPSICDGGTLSGDTTMAARVASVFSLRYQSDEPTIYWGIFRRPPNNFFGLGPFPSIVAADPTGSPWNPNSTNPVLGSAPNTGTLPDILLELITNLSSADGYCNQCWTETFEIYLDDRSFTLLDAGPLPLAAFDLGPARPNPMHAGTTLDFSLPSEGAVQLDIFDSAGRRVRSLEHRVMAAGPHVASWNGMDTRGHPAPDGIYYARLVRGDHQRVRRIALVR